MSSSRKELGAWGERLAVQYLQEKGYTILARNWKTKHGELDIVARERATIVFVEVKTRLASAYGFAEDSVTVKKQRTLRALAQFFLRSRRASGAPYRIDVIAITPRGADRPPGIHHIEDAVRDI